MTRPLLLALALALAACATTPPPPADAPPAPFDHLALEDPQDRDAGVHTWTSTPWSFRTNSFWIEAPEGVIVIDTQFLTSSAEDLLDHIATQTDKPVVLAVVLHPNPDKFNGAEVFQRRGIKVITSAQVLDKVPAVAAQRRRAFAQRYAPHYPTQDPPLTAFGDATQTLSVAGTQLTLHVLPGPGCSDAHVVATWSGHAFTGDLVASGTHAWLELGYASPWLDRLDEIAALQPARVHPGRGPSGGPELLTAQRAYLERVLAIIRAQDLSAPPSDDAIARVKAQLLAEYPDLTLDIFLFGLAKVWEREAQRPPAP
jgi:glyoxylase-like metal-dependent hydrolase (beta-lactamase superfamily II)